MTTAYASLPLAALLAAFALPAEAQVQVPCGDRTHVVSALQKDYSEAQVGAGVTDSGQLIEVFASNKGTWTLLLSLPTGNSCMIAAGEGWNGSLNGKKTSKVSDKAM